MLRIFNELKPFFEDNYKRIHVREYARTVGLSPPTASKLLNGYLNEGLLLREIDKGHHCYHSSRNALFVKLQQAYYSQLLSGVANELSSMVNPLVVVFGSVAKGEVTADSDIDLAVFSVSSVSSLDKFEKKLKRRLHVFHFKDEAPAELKKSIHNGFSILGMW